MSDIPEELHRTLLQLPSSDVVSADGLHRMVMDLFPVDLPESPRQAAGVLARQDGDRVLVQSWIPATRPVEGAVIAQVTRWTLPVGAGVVSVRARLVAETNTSGGPAFLPKEAKRRSERSTIPPEKRRQWIISKLAKHGLLFQTPPTVDTGSLAFTATTRPPIPFVDVVGTALVTDGTALRVAVANGVGRGRSYGFGLIDVGAVGG